MVLLRTDTLTYRLGSVIDEGTIVRIFSPKSNLLSREYVFLNAPPYLKTILLERILQAINTNNYSPNETVIDFDDSYFEKQGVFIRNHSRNAAPISSNRQAFMTVGYNILCLQEPYIRLNKNKYLSQGEFYKGYINTPSNRPIAISFIAPAIIPNVEVFINTLVFGENYMKNTIETKIFSFEQLLQQLELVGCTTLGVTY